jgi:hypothetical protein
VLGRHREEIPVMGGHVYRLLSLGSRFDPIEITFDPEGLV